MGLLNPGALVYASLYVVLVLLYLWDRIRRRVEVPSLLLWQAVSDDAVQARRFRPDWLFFLQALLLAALIGGLARPYLADGRPVEAARRHVFILDVSASMQAREGKTTRFAAALAALRDRLHALPTNDEMMLITAAARPEIVADFTRDRALLESRLAAVQPTDTGTALDLALAQAVGARGRTDALTDIEVFSDLAPSQLPARWRDEIGSGRMRMHQFGETDANLAITGLEIFQSRLQDPRAARAYVVVQNFSHREGHGGLTVRLNEAPVMQTGFSVPPRDARSFLVPSFPGPGRVVAQLDADDALAVDNVAMGWIRPLSTTRVLLVSPAGPLVDELAAVARATAGLHLITMTPDAYGGRAEDAADIVIFHRFVPASEPTVPALYVYPPRDNGLFAISGDVQGVDVLDWNDRHQAVAGLRPLATLPIQRARVILPAEWHEPLLWSRTAEREFPLALAGERNGRRLACLTFDLESERLLSSDNINFLLFFLNLLSWLAPQSTDVVTVSTGAVLPIVGMPPGPVRAIDPHGEPLDLGDSRSASLEVLTAGEYRVGNDGTQRVVYANFVDPTESDIGRAAKEPQPVSNASAAIAQRTWSTHSPGGEFGWWLLAVAATLLLVEWLLAMRVAERG
ncbi:MAG TPA: VWA domain-containing protein [Candidatus Binatia bacterium]|nr:VWA domain-containing protein [Candidatus Binatia bacterium]